MAEGMDEGQYAPGLPPHNNPPPLSRSPQPCTDTPRAPESWTPFSGMPSSPVSLNGLFSWEPTTPVPPYDNVQMPSYFSNFPSYPLPSVIHGASDSSGFPVGEGRSSSGFPVGEGRSSPVNRNSPIQRPSFSQCRQEGFDMYAEAIKQMQHETLQDTYGHFTTSSPTDVLSQPSTQDVFFDKKDSTSKPTYSDIAKSLKTKPMQKGKEEAEVVVVPKSKPLPDVNHGSAPVPNKPHKSHSKRLGGQAGSKGHTHRGSNSASSNDGNFGSVVSPDSKYGLDQFEEVDSGSSVLGGSNESLSYCSRQGSCSSLSSATSGIDETNLQKPFVSYPAPTLKDAAPKQTETKLDKDPEVIDKPATASKEKFFDPRRIFQTPKDSNKKKTEQKVGERSKSPDSSTVLNNGKPSATINKPPSAAHKKADYINNDLRDSRKRTNQTSVSTSSQACSQETEKKVASDSFVQNGSSDKMKAHGNQRRDAQSIRPKKFSPHFDWEAIDEYVNNVAEKMKNGVKSGLSLLFTMLLYVLGILMYIVFWWVNIIGVVGVKLWNWFSSKFFSNKFSYNSKPADSTKRKIGLEENIVLPSTGEEAMKRLLACKGKDPYSILGLRADASDEDVKKYYRKQAVLVHPDKNQELGAEESFKILGHAFEMIGEPSKRLQFDAKTREETEAESAMREFADLLTKLQEKIQEAANLMRCDNCGGKHKRIPINRPWYSARFCDKCNINHSAKEGDVWAETSMLGFLWHYYAIMDGNVYDITEWVACHKDFFKHMKANAHPILYRIATDGNKNHRSQGQSREAELEDFINQLFNKANMNDGSGVSSPWQHQKSQTASSSSSSHWNSNSGSGKKARSKKKKRH